MGMLLARHRETPVTAPEPEPVEAPAAQEEQKEETPAKVEDAPKTSKKKKEE